MCFNKCVFANVSLGENIFLLFLCVTSLGLSGEVKPTALALAPFLACPLTKLNGTDFQNCFCSFFLGFIVSQPVNFFFFLLSSMKDSGQAIPLVVESCIRYINLYGKLTQQY